MKKRKIDYTLRESQRAKRVILKVGLNGLEVVVPRRFGKRGLPGILEANREWIEKELQRVKERKAQGVLLTGDDRVILNRQRRPARRGGHQGVVLLKGLVYFLPSQGSEFLRFVICLGWDQASGQKPNAVVVSKIVQPVPDPLPVV